MVNKAGLYVYYIRVAMPAGRSANLLMEIEEGLPKRETLLSILGRIAEQIPALSISDCLLPIFAATDLLRALLISFFVRRRRMRLALIHD